MGMMNFYQLPDSYLSDYLTRVDKVDLAGVNTALRQKINPDKFLIVTVGDQTAIDSSDSDNAATEPTDSDANNTDSSTSDSNSSGANIVEKRTVKPIQ